MSIGSVTLKFDILFIPSAYLQISILRPNNNGLNQPLLKWVYWNSHGFSTFCKNHNFWYDMLWYMY